MRIFIQLSVLIVFSVFSQFAFSAEFDWSSFLTYIDSINPIIHTILTVLGGMVVIGTVVDGMVDDKIDGGFMKKLMALPVIGALLKAIAKFSPFNYR